MQEQQWEVQLQPAKIPTQSSSVDCGFFMMMAMKRITAGASLDFTQSQVSNMFRALCTLECACLQLSNV